jgi:hypothetical protein
MPKECGPLVGPLVPDDPEEGANTPEKRPWFLQKNPRRLVYETRTNRFPHHPAGGPIWGPPQGKSGGKRPWEGGILSLERRRPGGREQRGSRQGEGK